MSLENLIGSIMQERLREKEHNNDIYMLWLCRKHGNKNIKTRHRFIIGMPLGVIKVNNNNYYMYNDHKIMTLLLEIDDNNKVQKPLIMRWDKWTDGFISEKAIDRVVNNKYRYFVRILDRGNDKKSYKRLNRILRNNWDNFYFEFEYLENNVKDMLNNNTEATWDKLGRD